MNKLIFSYDNRKTFAQLFHAFPMEKEDGLDTMSGIRLMNNGIVVVTGESGIVKTQVDSTDAQIAASLFGLNNSIWGNSLHKTWNKVAESSDEQLLFEQIVHYMSTYGMEMLGQKAMPMIPAEAVVSNLTEVPNIRAFTVIRYVSVEEALEMVKQYLRVTSAPHKDLVDSIISLMALTDISPAEVKSFELKVARHVQTNTVPQKGEDFLRYMNFVLTGKTLLIKDKATIHMLKTSPYADKTSKMLAKANQAELAAIFYRYKPLFLAVKSHPGCSHYINKLRRLADKYHKPMSDVNVQNLSKLAMEHRYDDCRKVLQNASIRQLIKIINFTRCETAYPAQEANVYNIRNGKVYIHNHGANEKARNSEMILLGMSASEALYMKCAAMKSLKGKTFFIPELVEYAAPVTEKQFIGNIPYGTRIGMAEDSAMVPAVHWENYKGRTDLDLHLQSMTEAFGWNANYRSTSRSILYSGDMTDASHGAVEAYRLNPQDDERYLLTISNFSRANNVPFEFFMTNKGEKFTSRDRWQRNSEAVCDVKDALFSPIPLKFDQSTSQTIGLFCGHSFYFYGGELGGANVPKRDLYKDYLRAVETRLRNRLSINAIIYALGGEIVYEKEYAKLTEEQRAEVIDLSPANLTARSLLDIVDSDIQ